MDKELDIALDKYYEKFKDSFPTFPLRKLTPEEIINIINECIDKNKNVYELGYLNVESIY